jgi:hypothetical protein
MKVDRSRQSSGIYVYTRPSRIESKGKSPAGTWPFERCSCLVGLNVKNSNSQSQAFTFHNYSPPIIKNGNMKAAQLPRSSVTSATQRVVIFLGAFAVPVNTPVDCCVGSSINTSPHYPSRRLALRLATGVGSSVRWLQYEKKTKIKLGINERYWADAPCLAAISHRMNSL